MAIATPLPEPKRRCLKRKWCRRFAVGSIATVGAGLGAVVGAVGLGAVAVAVAGGAAGGAIGGAIGGITSMIQQQTKSANGAAVWLGSEVGAAIALSTGPTLINHQFKCRLNSSTFKPCKIIQHARYERL